MNIDLKPARLKELRVHGIGNKTGGEPLVLSPLPQNLSEEARDLLAGALMQKFKDRHDWYRFHHPSSLSLHPLHHYCTRLFRDGEDAGPVSADIARHLYDASTHHRVKSGELLVALLEGVPVEGRMYRALALFKAETKQSFLAFDPGERGLRLRLDEGTEPGALDKGCLILPTEGEEGYSVLLFDKAGRGEEAQYWRDTFLGVVPKQDAYHQTEQLLSLARQYITTGLGQQEELDRTEQAALLHRSMDYFKNKDAFDIEEFQQEVFQTEEGIEGFRNFGSRYTDSHGFDIQANFEISPMAVKKQGRVYKSVLKLDRNFHIYIHGNTDLIERGVDEQGRKFYKIFYEEEE